MTRRTDMAAGEAATRIVSIQETLGESFLGTAKRAELMTEQSDLWERHFEGKPFDAIARDAWLHKALTRYG